MVKRITYKQYKRNQRIYKPVAGSYDAATKTINVIIPDIKTLDFRSCKNFKCNGGNGYLLYNAAGVWTGVTVFQWNSGENANFLVENANAHYTSSEHNIAICGTGAYARTEAIKTAYRLAGMSL